MLIPAKYRNKNLKWWLQTPLYTSRIALYQFRALYRKFGFASQNGEDRVLAKLFKQPRGYCVEVGALDGISISNTYYFEKHKRGWKCLLVEADPISARQCARNRPRSITVGVAATSPDKVGFIDFHIIEHCRSMSGVSFDDFQVRHFEKHNTEFVPTLTQVPAETLDSILEKSNFPRVDFITIDVEGHELSVLQGFDIDRWKPKVVVLERLKTEPEPQIASYMKLHGYTKRFHMPYNVDADCNDFYFKN